MSRINLRAILELKNIKITTAGEKLFPGSKNPYVAIKRVIDGSQSLKEGQIIALSELTGLSIQELFGGNVWSGPKAKADTIQFFFGQYAAELNTQTWATTIYKNGAVTHTVEASAKGIQLSVYLEGLTEIINEIK